MQNTSNKKLNYKRLDEYKPLNFKIPEIHLNFVINSEEVQVISKFTLIKNNSEPEDLKFKGENICLKVHLFR